MNGSLLECAALSQRVGQQSAPPVLERRRSTTPNFPSPHLKSPPLSALLKRFPDSSNGQAYVKYSDGSSYDGEFKGGVRHGRGTLQQGDGSSYAGDWYEGQRHGHGKEVYGTGDVYAGSWRQGVRHGRGMLTCALSGARIPRR